MGSGSSNTKYKYKERPEEGEIEEKKVEKKVEKEEEKEEELNKEDELIPEQKKIKVIIPLQRGFWENSYDIETPLNKIELDFKTDNTMIIKKNHFIEFSHNNNPIEMDSTPIKSLINADTNTVRIAYEIKLIPGKKILGDNDVVKIVGKPNFDPFQIYTFEIESQIIKTIKFNNPSQIQQLGLDNFGPDSAYCNGNNCLYISGGVEQETNKIIGKLWIFDLNRKIFDNPIDISPKKNHSMIYDERKVYIVGGEDVNTMFYNVDNKEIKNWADLNNKRFEPSLIRYNNFLFCFDTSKKYLNNDNDFNFEKIDLLSESSEWEIIKPEISPNVLNSIFSQKFFGVVEDFKENIIFVGGIYDNENRENDINNNNRMYLHYNTNINTIETSNIQFKDLSFNEKAFLPFSENTYYILPNFNKRSPKVVYFYKDRNLLEIKTYHPNSRLRKKEVNKVKTTQIKPALIGLNFDMPKEDDFLRENNTNNNDIFNYGDYIRYNNNNKINYNFNLKNNINNIPEDNENENDKFNHNNYNNYDNGNDNNNNYDNDNGDNNEKLDNKDNNITSNFIKIELNQNNKDENNDINEKKPTINNNIDKISERNEERIKDNQNNDIKKEDSIKNKEENENKINNSHTNIINDVNNSQIKEEIVSKKETKSNNEEPLKNEDIKLSIRDSNKFEECKNDTPQNNNNYQKILYVEKPELFVNYHSSIDYRFNNNMNSNTVLKDIKKRKNIPPMNIDFKTLKKKINKMNKNQYNEFRYNKNY